MLGKRRHRQLLPIDRQIITALGLTEEQYRSYQVEAERRSRQRPAEGPVAVLLVPILINLAISAVLSAAAYLLTPRPRLKEPSRARPGELRQEQQQGQQLVSRTEFAPKQGISNPQDTIELGTTVPVIWAHRETIDGVTYGGVRVNCPLVWSQMQSLGGSQLWRGVYLVGEASVTGIDPQQFAFGENLLSAYDLGAAGEQSARVTIYHRPGGGRIRSTDRIAGRLAANDPGNAEAAGAGDVFQVRGLNNAWVPATCYSYTPSSQTTFGVYSPIGNGLAYRVNPSIRPITQANVQTPRNKDLLEQGYGLIVCSRDNAATAQRAKSDAISASRSGLTAHRRGGSPVIDNALLVGDELDLQLDSTTEAALTFGSGDYSESRGDIGTAVAGRQRGWDDALVVGELYRIGSAVCVCSTRSPSDDTFRSDVDQQPNGGGVTVTATFKVVEAGAADFPGTGGTRAGSAAPHVLRMARATVAVPQPAQVIEIGIRSQLGLRVSGLMNFRDAMPYAEVDGRACDYFNLSLLPPNQILRVTVYQSNTITQTETRYAFNRLRYRIAGSGSAWSEFPQLFGFSGATQQAQFNFIRLEFPTRQRWEVRIDPVSGWEVRSGTASGDLVVIDARLSTLLTLTDGAAVVRVPGTIEPRQASTFQMPCTINARGGIGMPNVDGGNYVDEWARLAEQFVYDEIAASCASGPEHEIAYVNVIDTAPTTPEYPDLTLVGVCIRSSTEATQLGQLSAFVNDGIDGSHSFPDLLTAGLTNTRYGVGSILSPLQVDLASFASAAQWCRDRGYFYDGTLQQPVNMRGWGNDTAALFLLDLVTRNGVSYLQPAVLFDEAEEITGLFNAGNIIEGSFKLSYLEQVERQPCRVSVKWREERRAEGDGSNRGLFPVIREVTIREAGTSETAPLEVIDLSDFCTSERHAIDVGKLKARLKRLITHQVAFETIPQQAMLSPGRCFRLAMETVAYATPRNGAILADGTITASEAMADGAYPVLLWDGVGQIQETQLQVLAGRAVGQGQAVFTLADVFGTETTYKVQSMAFNDKGNIEVTALHWPTTDGFSDVATGWEAPGNWTIEGAIGSTDAPGSLTASFTGVQITGPGTLTVGVAGSYAAVISGTGTGFTYAWSGAGLTFGSASAATTTITASSAGAKAASCAVTRGAVTITDTHPILAVAAGTTTTIGTVTITGSTTGTSPLTATYTAAVSGNATDLTYSWTAPIIPAGGAVSFGSTNGSTSSVTLTGAGTYQLACRVGSYTATDRVVDKAVTFNLSTDTATATAHGLAADDQVTFSATTGTLPTGLLEQTTYWVRSGGLTADAFTVAATPGGALLDISGTASGTYRVGRLGRSDLHQVVVS